MPANQTFGDAAPDVVEADPTRPAGMLPPPKPAQNAPPQGNAPNAPNTGNGPVTSRKGSAVAHAFQILTQQLAPDELHRLHLEVKAGHHVSVADALRAHIPLEELL